MFTSKFTLIAVAIVNISIRLKLHSQMRQCQIKFSPGDTSRNIVNDDDQK